MQKMRRTVTFSGISVANSAKRIEKNESGSMMLFVKESVNNIVIKQMKKSGKNKRQPT